MALISSVWGHTPRPWGYEVRVDFKDTGVIYNEVMTFKQEPSAKEIDDKVASVKVALESRISLEAAEALKPPEPTKEELSAKVATLEAQKIVLTKQVADLTAIKVVK